MDSRTILYRGSLKSCNYRCSYCPFAKHPQSLRERKQDREEWEEFCSRLKSQNELHPTRYGIMVVPYGEALIHPWYWNGLGELSALELVEAVGAQTNLSFSLEEALSIFQKSGGKKEKLRLWATFHPEMISVSEFAEKCQHIQGEGIQICAGAVGVPENLPLLNALRSLLPEEIYLWINKMDGLKRPYTPQEKEEFLRIDPYFYREMALICADAAYCKYRIFVEGSGTTRNCNISIPYRTKSGPVPKGPVFTSAQIDIPQKKNPENVHLSEKQDNKDERVQKCGRRICSCYLAYGGREEFINKMLFGNYPIFRIPQLFSAAFFDIDGTLIPRGSQKIPPLIIASLQALARRNIPLFFATNLPINEARKRCRQVWNLFSGGIFAAGAHIAVFGNAKDNRFNKTPGEQPGDTITDLHSFIGFGDNTQKIEMILETWKKAHPCKMRIYRKDEVWIKKSVKTYTLSDKIWLSPNGINIHPYTESYKITLTRPRLQPWKSEEAEDVYSCLSSHMTQPVRVITEENCLQVVSAQASKAKGIAEICRFLHIPLEKTVAAGDSREDEEMLALCKRGIKAGCR